MDLTNSSPMHRLAIAALIAAALASVGCGDDDKNDETSAGTTPQPAQPAGQQLNVVMKEFQFEPSALKAKKGKITFTAANQGKTEHELVLLRTDKDPAKLPAKNGRVDESASVGEIEEVPPKKSGAHTFNLKPGKYVMICNLPGHYEGGMYGTVTVR